MALRLLGRRLHAHVHATTGLALERNFALGCGKDCMILADANVLPRVVLGAPLADAKRLDGLNLYLYGLILRGAGDASNQRCGKSKSTQPLRTIPPSISRDFERFPRICGREAALIDK